MNFVKSVISVDAANGNKTLLGHYNIQYIELDFLVVSNEAPWLHNREGCRGVNVHLFCMLLIKARYLFDFWLSEVLLLRKFRIHDQIYADLLNEAIIRFLQIVYREKGIENFDLLNVALCLQIDCEGRAFAKFARHVYAATHLLDNLLADGQA